MSHIVLEGVRQKGAREGARKIVGAWAFKAQQVAKDNAHLLVAKTKMHIILDSPITILAISPSCNG